MKLKCISLYSEEYFVFTPFIASNSQIIQAIEIVKKGEIKNIPIIQKFIIYSKIYPLSSLFINVASWSRNSLKPEFITDSIPLEVLRYRSIETNNQIKILAESWKLEADNIIKTILLFEPMKQIV